MEGDCLGMDRIIASWLNKKRKSPWPEPTSHVLLHHISFIIRKPTSLVEGEDWNINGCRIWNR